MLSSRSGRFRLRLLPRIIVFATVAYVLSWISGFPLQYDDEELPPSAQRPKPSLEPFPVEPDKLVVTVKTTAVDAFAKVPPMIVMTDGRYHDNLLFMGDLHMDVGIWHIFDVLDRYDRTFLDKTPEMERYRRQLDYARRSIPLSTIREEDATEEKEALRKLDKYKILRMLEKAWEMRPERKWYVFMDDDTYLARSNLLSWLGQFDNEKPVFFANPPSETVEPFAMGGSTIILSVQAMRSLFVDHEKLIPRWDSRLQARSSALDVIGTVLATETTLKMNNTWPSITGFNPNTIPYGPGMWCELMIAMHSVPSDLASDVFRFQRDREEFQHVRDPLSYADLWLHFMQPENLDKERDDWDNLSSGSDNAHWNILFEGVDKENNANRNQEPRAASGEESWESCRNSCNNSDFCVQWSYSSTEEPNYNLNPPTKCHLSRSMRFGSHVAPGREDQTTWTSGWRKDRFQAWAKQQRCKEQQN
ncbi:hypothetical protein BDV95DRAFT_209045 [Massariosphaeria phaeospora]|uniref:N-acetylgalactosaminide beta-1,3-galactosyltransferase n=1 Tax=Massariosphaeria phaeospora TaxID=100035 RepID=A0A7C8I6G5_9PLEO|nr:hypothetical protein BDV95DRAFT_209045 [Massariosphaeria phaeospora]